MTIYNAKDDVYKGRVSPGVIITIFWGVLMGGFGGPMERKKVGYLAFFQELIENRVVFCPFFLKNY